jgi:hypothetical protein
VIKAFTFAMLTAALILLPGNFPHSRFARNAYIESVRRRPGLATWRRGRRRKGPIAGLIWPTWIAA